MTVRRKTELSDTVNYGLYLPSNTLILTGEVDEEMAHRVTCAAHYMDGEGREVQVILNTYGGCIYNGFAIYDVLKGLKAHLTIKGIGMIMSMGAVILQAADSRVLAPNTTVMLHEGSNHTGPQPMTDHQADGLEGIRIRDRVVDVLAAKMGISRRAWLSRYRHTTYMDAHEAVSLGLADLVLD